MIPGSQNFVGWGMSPDPLESVSPSFPLYTVEPSAMPVCPLLNKVLWYNSQFPCHYYGIINNNNNDWATAFD